MFFARMASGRERRFIVWLEEIGANDAPFVGTKVALQGEGMRHLGRSAVRVPVGFAVTARAYRHLVKEAGLLPEIGRVLSGLDLGDSEGLVLKAKQARDVFLRARFPSSLEAEIGKAYRKLRSRTGSGDVVIRSSPLDGPAFNAPVGLHDALLNVRGDCAVLDACRRCFASLFTARAVADRLSRGIDPVGPALALAVQQMVRSDRACSGRAFGFEPRSGFPQVIAVKGTYGVLDRVGDDDGVADEFLVHRPTLRNGFRSLVSKRLGAKTWRWIPGTEADRPLASVAVPERDRRRYVLDDHEALELARATMTVESHLGHAAELTWAKDGDGVRSGSGALYLLEVRPVSPLTRTADLPVYAVDPAPAPREIVLKGNGVGDSIGCGQVKVIRELAQLREFTVGSVLVTDATDSEWEDAMRASAAVVTVRGDQYSHAARYCRDRGIPCVFGAGLAAMRLHDGMQVTVDCRDATGVVMRGLRSIRIEGVRPGELPETKVRYMLIAGPQERVLSEAQRPVDGVVMLSIDGILEEQVGIHPFALCDFDQLRERHGMGNGGGEDLIELVEAIEARTAGYRNRADWLVDELCSAIGVVASGSYREVGGQVAGDVLVRLSSLSSDRYLRLLGGGRFEPGPSDPARALRGAARHCHPVYGRAFSLECGAIKRVRDEMGLSNVKVMVPYCRTPEEGRRLLSVMAQHGLSRGDHGLEVYLQVQMPSNILLVEQFIPLFDGFVIDVDDLPWSVLGGVGVDHDEQLFGEGVTAARRLCAELLDSARRSRSRRRVGFCARRPEAMPAWIAFAAEHGVDFIATRPHQLAVARLLAAFAERARAERKQLAVVEQDPATGREVVRLGVPYKWLKDHARRWARPGAEEVRELSSETKKAAATLLSLVAPRVVIDGPGQTREVLCWRLDDVDAAKESRAIGATSIRVRTVGSLSVQELVEAAHQWRKKRQVSGRRLRPTDPSKMRGLVKRFESARADFVSEVQASVVTELFSREVAKG